MADDEEWLVNAFFAGLAGGIAGLIAMNVALKRTKQIVPDQPKRVLHEGESPSWSLVGTKHEPDESATQALARVGYQRLTGAQLDADAKHKLGTAIHWAYGMGVGVLFGLLRGSKGHPVVGGAVYGIGLWAFGDLLGTAVLGLADKPTRYVPEVHIHSLVGHLAYGVATGVATRTTYTIMARA